MSSSIYLGTISIDCRDATSLRDFYADLLGWERLVLFDYPAARGDTGTFLFIQADGFEYVSPVWPEEPGVQQKQIHLDFEVDDLATATAHAESLGAVRSATQPRSDEWIVMLDPDGHPFCLCGVG